MATSDQGGKDGMEEGHAGDLSYSFSWVLDTRVFPHIHAQQILIQSSQCVRGNDSEQNRHSVLWS